MRSGIDTIKPDRRDGTAQASNIDPAEVERFARMADEWWDPNGKFRPLHQLGPTRLSFIRERALQHFDRDGRQLRPFGGLGVLDIGCGGGLVAEPMARLGGAVTAIDPAAENIAAARQHAEAQGLAIDYRSMMAEDLVSEGREFDLVLCLEVVEHVPDVPAFVALCARLVRPGGLLVLSTINRTIKAYALAIVGAEYILRWLPAGTHQWERFVTPDELRRHTASAGLVDVTLKGLVYDVFSDRWSLSDDTDVNYMASARKS